MTTITDKLMSHLELRAHPVMVGDVVQFRKRKWLLLNKISFYLLGFGPGGSLRTSSAAEFDKSLAPIIKYASQKSSVPLDSEIHEPEPSISSDFDEYYKSKSQILHAPKQLKRHTPEPPTTTAIVKATTKPGFFEQAYYKCRRVCQQAADLSSELASVPGRSNEITEYLNPILDITNGEIQWVSVDDIYFHSSPKYLEVFDGNRRIMINSEFVKDIYGSTETQQYRLVLWGNGVILIDLRGYHDLFWTIVTEDCEVVLNELMSSRGKRLRSIDQSGD